MNSHVETPQITNEPENHRHEQSENKTQTYRHNYFEVRRELFAIPEFTVGVDVEVQVVGPHGPDEHAKENARE